MPAVTDADGNVAQVSPAGALHVAIVEGNVDITAISSEYVKNVAGNRINPATEETVAALRTDRDFSRILKFEPLPTEEIRRDETLTDDYHGVAPDGSATSAAVWKVVRFYKTAGLITRVRYRTDIAWDSRTAGW